MSTSSGDTPDRASTAPSGEAAETGTPVDGFHRRAPRLSRFLLAGVLLGALAAAIVVLIPGVSEITAGNLFVLTFLSTGLGGVIVGLIAFLIADRRSLRDRDQRAAREHRSRAARSRTDHLPHE